MNPSYKPKLSIELTPEQQSELRAIQLSHGWQRAVFSRIIDDLIQLNHDYGPTPLALMMTGKVTPRDIIPSISTGISSAKKLN